jgi:hypothetical protein
MRTTKSAITVFIAVFLMTAAFDVLAQVNDMFEVSPGVIDPFARLKNKEIFGNDDVMNDEIVKEFRGRERQAIESAVNNLRSARFPVINGRKSDRSMDMIVAKKIFQSFPNESMELLKREYESGNALIRGNIIEMIGKIDQETEVRPLLIEALNDQTPCEPIYPDMPEAVPLRVCDKAYNQTVLRYGFRDVLRTISTMHSIEARDHHIQTLKNRIF